MQRIYCIQYKNCSQRDEVWRLLLAFTRFLFIEKLFDDALLWYSVHHLLPFDGRGFYELMLSRIFFPYIFKSFWCFAVSCIAFFPNSIFTSRLLINMNHVSCVSSIVSEYCSWALYHTYTYMNKVSGYQSQNVPLFIHPLPPLSSPYKPHLSHSFCLLRPWCG